MAQLPIFAAGSNYKSIQAGIDSSILSYPAYVYVRDEKKLAFIDKDNSINLIVGDNKKQIVKSESLELLPEIGDEECLYIVDGIVYTYNSSTSKYTPSYVDHTADIEALETRVTALETSNETLTGKIDTLEGTVNNIQVSSGITFVELESEESTDETA